jgi:hypothetical protein
MKNSRSLVAAFVALALASSVFASRPQNAEHGDSCATVKPVAAKIVNPTMLPRTFKRSLLKLEFSLDENGQPKDIEVLSIANEDVKTQVVKAFKEWRFDVPATASHTSATRYRLPLDIIPRA